MGAVNGLLIAKLKLPPFIVTLGTWQILLAVELHLFGERDDPQSADIAEEAPALQLLGPWRSSPAGSRCFTPCS